MCTKTHIVGVAKIGGEPVLHGDPRVYHRVKKLQEKGGSLQASWSGEVPRGVFREQRIDHCRLSEGQPILSSRQGEGIDVRAQPSGQDCSTYP